ncbi:MAG TPA: vWA domain-containing protein [Bryobacterales bacterium]|jgi:hypothetical protein|nr:vWA domain-containing protein [Bryobacterales bacterium]
MTFQGARRAGPGIFFALLSAAVVWLAPEAWAQGQTAHLEFSDKLRLVNCEPTSSSPCFRIRANIVDAQGAPVSPALPPPAQLAKNLTVRADDLEVTPFYAVAGSSGATVARSRIALILIDISGSMNEPMGTGQSRFAAATSAALQFLDGFENGTDRVAIVPFESHQVIQTIRAAKFASTVEEARQQVRSLPAPQPKNNTALFSAVDASLDVLAAQMAAAQTSPETMLVVMTDGKNDVRQGDDLGLLSGPSGLATVANKVKASGIQVVSVGIGDNQSIDSDAMRQISTQFYLVSDAESLKRVFSLARKLLVNRIQATFTSPWADRASLAGKTLHVRLSLKLANGEQISSNEIVWSTPQMGVPLFEGKCEAPEMKALLAQATPPSTGGWWALLRPVLVFVSIGVTILVMWFWVPRLVWPEQYLGELPATASGGRWSGQTQIRRTTTGPRRNAPPGFDATSAGRAGAQRGPGDATIVRPRTDFGTRTRLEGRRQRE